MEYKQIIAIDFDGTIANVNVVNGVPVKIHKPLENAIEVIKELANSGKYELILWTCRADMYEIDRMYLCMALEWLTKYDIYHCFAGFNTQPMIWKQHPLWGRVYARKIYADIYIDDKNFGGFPGWLKIKEVLL